MEYPTKIGNTYQIEVSADLMEWINWGDSFTGTGEVMQWFASWEDYCEQRLGMTVEQVDEYLAGVPGLPENN